MLDTSSFPSLRLSEILFDCLLDESVWLEDEVSGEEQAVGSSAPPASTKPALKRSRRLNPVLDFSVELFILSCRYYELIFEIETGYF
jgi:hypothetical protein